MVYRVTAIEPVSFACDELTILSSGLSFAGLTCGVLLVTVLRQLC
jgi:hypothetical protein